MPALYSQYKFRPHSFFLYSCAFVLGYLMNLINHDGVNAIDQTNF